MRPSRAILALAFLLGSCGVGDDANVLRVGHVLVDRLAFAPLERFLHKDRVIRRTVRLAVPDGLHARPCAIAQAMKCFRGNLEIRFGDRKADARSILEMMTLSAGEGAELELVASGEDAAQLIEAVIALLK